MRTPSNPQRRIASPRRVLGVPGQRRPQRFRQRHELQQRIAEQTPMAISTGAEAPPAAMNPAITNRKPTAANSTNISRQRPVAALYNGASSRKNAKE